MSEIGKRVWVIAEGYIPSKSTGPSPAMISHETACILNPGDASTEVEITLFFEDREPGGPYKLTVEGRRTRHVRFNAPDRRPAYALGFATRGEHSHDDYRLQRIRGGSAHLESEFCLTLG